MVTVSRLALQHRKLRYHRLCLGQLILSAVRHQHGACADGAVEHLHQSLLGAYSLGQPGYSSHFARTSATSFSYKVFVLLGRTSLPLRIVS